MSSPAHAAESDPYWGWRAPPRDETEYLDRAINLRVVRGLADANARKLESCRDVAAVIVGHMEPTATHFFMSTMRRWPMDRSPRAARGADRSLFDEVSVYRDAPLLPLGHAVPLDPTLQANGVLFGPDKLGHFFTNGLRSYGKYLAAKARGVDDAAAYRAAMLYGIEEEHGILGIGIDGIFSFGDLHSNMAGVRFFRALCDDVTDELPQLSRGSDGRWTMTPLFALSRWVDPCWDESFAPSAFASSEADKVEAALVDVCPLLDSPAVRARRAAYRARGCHAPTTKMLDALVADGTALDPSRWDIERVCAAPGARPLTAQSR